VSFIVYFRTILAILILMIQYAHISLANTPQRSMYIIHMDKPLMPDVFTNHHHCHTSIVNSFSLTSPSNSFNDPKSRPSSSARVLYSYNKALHGFSALLSLDELQSLKKHLACITAYKETKGTIDTTRTTDFLCLNYH